MELVLAWKPGRNGTGVVTVRRGDDLLHSDKLDPRRASARKRFANELAKKCPKLQSDDIELKLLALVEKLSKTPETTSTPDPLAATPAPIRDTALAMLRDPELIRRVVHDVAALGVAGEKMLIATIYLVGTSRLLAKPLAAIAQGPTSSGKSYVIDTVAKLFPPEAVIRAHKMTPEALIHMPAGALEHRFVVGGERSRRQDDDTADATRALREMLSDGRLTKLMPTKSAGGGIETVQIDQPGPIAYVESTTLQTILDEDRNRCLILATDESPAQTRRILDLAAAQKINPDAAGDVTNIIAEHHAAQRLLHRVRVKVPYADELARRFPAERTDARRAFGHLLSMIEAVTLLHQFQRVPEPADGLLIVATVDDYRIARKLLAGPFARALGDGLSDAARRFGERLRETFTGNVEFDTREIAKHERVIGDRQTMRQYVRALASAGWLDQMQLQQGPKPALYRVAMNVPDDAAIAGLPDPAELFPADAGGDEKCIVDCVPRHHRQNGSCVADETCDGIRR